MNYLFLQETSSPADGNYCRKADRHKSRESNEDDISTESYGSGPVCTRKCCQIMGYSSLFVAILLALVCYLVFKEWPLTLVKKLRNPKLDIFILKLLNLYFRILNFPVKGLFS